MKKTYDAIVIGAGPSGIACATELAGKGLDVAVVDEQAGPGGQIYRNITGSSAAQQKILGTDYTDGLELVNAFSSSAVDYFPQSRVWQAAENGAVYFSRNGVSQQLRAPNLVLCTGAMERPVPFPGWTLPGVMTCGGMSNLYKDSGLVPSQSLVIAGSGPFVWLVSEHLLALDVPIAAILDTAPLKQVFPALKQVSGAVKRLDFMMKGVRLIGDVYLAARKKRVPIYRNVTELQAQGAEKLERVSARAGKKQLVFDVDTLLVSEGIIPNTALFRQVGCSHRWDPVQRYWHPEVRGEGQTSLSSVYIAGDGGFVHGAKSAEYKGRITALHIAKEMHRLSTVEYEEQLTPVRKQLDRELFPRPFIDALYAPRRDLFALDDETVVCRCEGVSAGRVRELVRQGLTDHNEIKAIIRCGMGPCQGRMCSAAVLELISEVSGMNPANTRQHRLRPPIKPVSLQELANAQLGEEDES
ncbi:MAG: FAD-dependent oxidoreductase [Desulfocapsaceae bacterium]|jgi:thioredoxin reductase/bacterioferritin-associated ferredoxin|nr:FAD-dependent oxidoreductase [Desulfocapsaceae bacterium]